jgi:hypothetical protein
MTIEAIKTIKMVYANTTKHDWPDDIWDAICQAIEAEKQEQGEPVAWMDRDGDIYKELPNEYWNPPHTPIYAQREWVGLTDEDMKDPRTHNFDFIHGARWAEAKLKEKNGG